MDKLSYGYVEAAHYWWEEIKDKFEKDDYAVSKKDKCVFYQTQGRESIILWNQG
jgi:hypothetical protein